MKAITIIDVENFDTFATNGAETFLETGDGEGDKAAKKRFTESVREAAGDEQIGDDRIEHDYAKGAYENGQGGIVVIEAPVTNVALVKP